MTRFEIEGFISTARGFGWDIRRNGNPKGYRISKYYTGDDGEQYEDIEDFAGTLEAAERVLASVGKDIAARIMGF